ncbi:hypothetical protein CEXT_142501 [Caerostris extrusa]|uniref:Uncharacterized protein n=1 Tax=Caerostris extrusa TaxID=172846 RepID=A0AAV4ULC2_CAEEX|nr:hypothetical protein CEXT_142501 [Caerostris extrusa]
MYYRQVSQNQLSNTYILRRDIFWPRNTHGFEVPCRPVEQCQAIKAHLSVGRLGLLREAQAWEPSGARYCWVKEAAKHRTPAHSRQSNVAQFQPRGQMPGR